MAEISKEIMQRREEQLEGLRKLFTRVFSDYQTKYGELPKLVTETDVNVFVQARPEIWRTIQRQDLVLANVTKVALEVLNKMQKNQGNRKTEETV